MTAGAGSAAATTRAPRKRVKKPRPTALAPLPAPHNQREDGLLAARVPLEAVFVSRFRRVLLRHITLSGWDPTDADLALLTAGRDGSHARVETLTLDDCAHVTLRGLRSALPVLQNATVLRLRRCAGLSSELPALLPLSLVEVDLSYCEWLDDSAVRVLARRCLALRRVSLAHCRRLTDYGVSAFADVAVSSLTHLDLSRLPRVTDTCLLALLLRCTKLQWLDASQLSAVEGLTLQGLPRNSAPALATLHVAHDTRMHFLTLAHLVRTLDYGALTDVDVSHCAQLTDETLVALGRYAPALATLRLAFCTQVTDAGVARLVEFQPLANDQLADFLADDAARPRCTQLTTLDLTGCHQITSDGLVAVARQCHALETLMVDGLRRLDARGLHALATHCSRLAVLHWGGILIQSGPGSDAGFFSVPSVDRAAAQALRACRSLHTLAVGATACDVAALADVLLPVLGPQLRDLDASGVATDALLRSVAAHCTQLRTLRLSRSRYFSHAAFLAVATHCRQLRTLELESCEQLRDEALVTLARHGGASLQTLVVSNDWQLTDTGITALAQRCPRLRRLAVRHCPEVSPLCLRGIAASVNSFVIATRDGLEPKPAAITAFLTLENELEAAARRLTRWWRDCLLARTQSTSAIDRALRHVRRRRRCVVRIQRCVRRWLARLRALRLVAHAQRERQRTCDAHWLWLVAYARVGKLLRRYCRQWRVERHDRAYRLAEREHERRDHAAREIQRVYWGWRGRSRARERQHEVIQWRQRRLAGACCLQRVWRGVCGRTAAHARALACWRRLLTTADAMARQHAATLHLTRAVRGFLGRCHTRRRRIDRDAMRLRRVAAARTIQRGARAYLVRVLFRGRRARGATQMQRIVRGFLGRRHARRVILIHAYAAAPILLLLNHRSIFTRDLAVAWKTKRDAGERLAIACQCVYRGYFYGRLQRRRRLAQRRQLAFERDAGARTLQHFFRSLLIVGRLAVLQFTLHLRRHSATKVQSVWRMWLGKVRATAVALRRERTRRHAATLQQLATASPSSDRRRRLLQLGAVHVLVVSYRRSLALRGWQTPSVVRFRHACAATIQSLVRGVQTRQRVARLREQLTWAARLVQRVWRGRLGRKQWRVRITEYRLALRRQQEEDRAMRIASKRTGQFVVEAQLKHERHARVLQQWIRTLQRRQLFKQARDAQDAARRKQATQKLASVLTRATESVVFQARVWRECVDRKQQLNELDEPDVVAMEREVAALKRACLDEYVAHAAAAAQRQSLAKRKRDTTTTKKRLLTSAANVKQTIQPFAEQAKQLTLASARVHFANRQLQDELRVLQRGVAAFHVALQAALPLDPLLYERDVEMLVARLGLPVGRVSILDQEEGETEAKRCGSSAVPQKRRRISRHDSPVCVLVCLLFLLLVAAVDAQVIAAPDQGDELESRAFVDGQGRLDDAQHARAQGDRIDINVYSYETPTQFVMGLLLDPCRDRDYVCCSDRFGEPAYTTDALAAKEKISLLDESGAPLQVSTSRLGDRPSLFDPDCYADPTNNTFYRLRKVHTTNALVVSKQYTQSGCVGRLRALAPLDMVVMPPCWDRNDSINALARCYGVDGRRKNNCVAVAYMQNALIAQCFGAFALDNHCGTFLELHEPGSETILSQTRLLGEYTSGFRTTTLPLIFQGDRTRTICRGAYEIWWVLRTRYNFIVQKKKRFAVVEPPCDFDFATNKYKNFHILTSDEQASTESGSHG